MVPAWAKVGGAHACRLVMALASISGLAGNLLPGQCIYDVTRYRIGDKTRSQTVDQALSVSEECIRWVECDPPYRA